MFEESDVQEPREVVGSEINQPVVGVAVTPEEVTNTNIDALSVLYEFHGLAGRGGGGGGGGGGRGRG